MSLVRQRALHAALLAPLSLGLASGHAAAQPAQTLSMNEDPASAEYTKTTELTMPINDLGMKLGDAIVLGGADGSLLVQRDSFLTALGAALRPAAFQAFKAALPSDKHVSLAAITSAGIPIRFNPDTLELIIALRVEQRPRGEISGPILSSGSAEAGITPALLSGYLNAHFGVEYERQEGRSGQLSYPAILLDGAGRWGGAVLEGTVHLTTDGGVARQGTRLIYDFPESVVRVSAGDLALGPSGSFSMPPILGAAIQKSYTELQPTTNIRPTGRRSFRIERSSEVVIRVNGDEARRVYLQPGEYDLDDLPLASGTNDIQLTIRDEFGTEETLDFSIMHNRILLDPGISEWTLAAGIRAQSGSLSPGYDEETPVALATYRQGLTETITGSFSAQSSDDASLLGAGVLSQTAYGLLSLEAALSGHRYAGLGWSVSGELELETDRLWGDLNAAQVGFELVGEDFASSLGLPSTEGRARLNGSVSRRFSGGLSISLGGYYQLAEEELDRGFGTSFSISRVLGQGMVLGISGYYDERGTSGFSNLGDASVFARLNYRPSRESYIALEYNHALHGTSIAAGSNHQQGASRASVSAEWAHAPKAGKERQRTEASVDLFYTTDRFELNASHNREFANPTGGTQVRRSSVNGGAGVAFADGKVAFGRPVRGGFAIFDTHASLNDSGVRIDPHHGYYKAASDGWGPVLVSDISAYAPTNVTYEVDDLPAGYDLGSGALTMIAPYKAGYAIQIGSEFAVTAIGILLDEGGTPIAMKAGMVTTPAHPEKQIVFFTNASGHFTMQGLKAGDWDVVIQEDTRKFRIRISGEANGLVELGSLRPRS